MRKFSRAAALVLPICLLMILGAAAQPTKLAALTFDDGPSPTYSPQVLDTLTEKRARATFFLVGKWLPGKSSIVLREVADGHQIANHTYNHVRLTTLTPAEIRDSLTSTADALTAITGQTDFMVRPPFGARNQMVLSNLDAPGILWSVDPAAGKQITTAQMKQRVLSRTADGGIILMHDTTAANADAVADIIDGLRARGYELVTVRELFRLKGVTPENNVLYQRVTNSRPEAYDETKLSSHWAYSAICDLEKRGVMTGGSSGWQPNRYVTRAQAICVLWRMCGSPKPQSASGFSDVSSGAYYAAAAAWGRESGVLTGKSDGTFSPRAKVTREQLYVMLSRLARQQGTTAVRTSDPASYDDDARIGAWAQESVWTIRKMGFSSRNDVEIFRPRDWATRAETAEILDWYVNLA